MKAKAKPEVGMVVMMGGEKCRIVAVHSVERAMDVQQLSDGRTFRWSGLYWDEEAK